MSTSSPTTTGVAVFPALLARPASWADWCVHVLLTQLCVKLTAEPNDVFDRFATQIDAYGADNVFHRDSLLTHVKGEFANSVRNCDACQVNGARCTKHAPWGSIVYNVSECLKWANPHNSCSDLTISTSCARLAAKEFCRSFVPATDVDGLTISLAGSSDELAEVYANACAVLVSV